MKSWQTTALTAVLAFGLLAATGCSMGDNTPKEKVSEQSYDAASITAVEIQADSGNLIVKPSDSDKIGAALYATNSAKDHYTLESETKGSTLVLHLVFKNKDDLISVGSGQLDVTIPKKQYDKLLVKSGSGNLELHSAQAKNITLDSQSGNVTTDDLQGDDLRINASSGNVKLNNATLTNSVSIVNQSGNQEINGLKCSKSDFNTYSGNLKLKGVTSPDLVAHSGSGNVDLYLAEMSRNAEVTGNSGNLNVYLPKDAAFDVSGSTGAGNAKIDFDLSGTKNDRSFQGTVGKGGNKLKVETINGNVKVAKQ